MILFPEESAYTKLVTVPFNKQQPFPTSPSRSQRFRSLSFLALGIGLVGGFGFLTYRLLKPDSVSLPRVFHREMTRHQISEVLGRRRITAENLRESLSFSLDDDRYEIVSTVQIGLQEKIESLYRRYDPMYAAFVALDPESGEILAMADHSRIGHENNLNLRGTFPAASVFKIVTSAAAIESAKMGANTPIPFTGSYSTLYKRNLTWQESRWTRKVPLSEALGKSINSIFGKVAIKGVGREGLQHYANAFGFNQAITFDMPVDISNVVVPEDDFGIAESGSGYTKKQTLSPIQGALIAATIANDGQTPQPTIVRAVYDETKFPVYQFTPSPMGSPISAETARQLALMMEKTITQGTARKTFRDYDRHPVLKKLFIGAKTGSLTGNDPQGKYDWFVGFARSHEDPRKQIAFASLIVNDRFWRVKSSYVAREVLIEYFSVPEVNETVSLAK